MNQPLDFSRSKKPVAAPPAPAQREPKGRRTAVVLAAAAAVLAIGYLAVTLFDRGKDPAKHAVETAQYCQLVLQLEQVSVATGAASAAGVYDGPPEKVKAAVDQMGGTLQQLGSLAPEAVQADVGEVTDALRRAAGGDAGALKKGGFTTALQRMNAHRTATCSAGAGDGDG